VIDAVATIEDAGGMDQARELAEKAEAEGRDMTAEEQASYDEIMKRGRSVADAVKSHHHDQEVWAFAKSKITLMLF